MLHTLSALELGQKLAQRDVSALEVADYFLDRVALVDSQVNAFLTVEPEVVRAQAVAAQALIDSAAGGPLTGVPIALKDNLSTEGLRTTCASKILDNYIPPYNATVVEKLTAAGMINLGKTNLDEFAMGTSCENSAYFPTRNPWNLECTPGGSSGGSAASVAAEMCPLSLGSDTGGSIRMPASLCGLVGFKPTYGRVSRYGLVAFGSSLDQIGPFSRNVEDCAAIAHVISGKCQRDSTSLPDSQIAVGNIKNGSLKGLKFAVPEELLTDAIQPGIRAIFETAVSQLEAEGVSVARVKMPSILYGVTTYYIIAPAEASSNLARFDGIRFGPLIEGDGHIDNVAKTRGQLFGHEVKSRIMIGTYALSAGYYDAYYVRAQQVRGMMSQEFEEMFQTYDAVLNPTSPVVAFKLGALTHDPLALKALDLCTIPANMGGFPSISINAGFDNQLPVGIQLTAPAMADETLLQMAYSVEQALPAARWTAPMK